MRVPDYMVEAVAYQASYGFIPESIKEKLTPDELDAVMEVANMVREEKKGLVYCGICGKGSFTKRGFFLHLMRVHSDDIKTLLAKVLEELPSIPTDERKRKEIEIEVVDFIPLDEIKELAFMCPGKLELELTTEGGGGGGACSANGVLKVYCNGKLIKKYVARETVEMY